MKAKHLASLAAVALVATLGGTAASVTPTHASPAQPDCSDLVVNEVVHSNNRVTIEVHNPTRRPITVPVNSVVVRTDSGVYHASQRAVLNDTFRAGEYQQYSFNAGGYATSNAPASFLIYCDSFASPDAGELTGFSFADLASYGAVQRAADGTAVLTPFNTLGGQNSFRPVVLNEVQPAENGKSGFIEVYNPSNFTVDLTWYRVTLDDRQASTAQWLGDFGSTPDLRPGEYALVDLKSFDPGTVVPTKGSVEISAPWDTDLFSWSRAPWINEAEKSGSYQRCADGEAWNDFKWAPTELRPNQCETRDPDQPGQPGPGQPGQPAPGVTTTVIERELIGPSLMVTEPRGSWDDGVDFSGDGWVPEMSVRIWSLAPNGSYLHVETVTPDRYGNFTVLDHKFPHVEGLYGTYTVRATQEVSSNNPNISYVAGTSWIPGTVFSRADHGAMIYGSVFVDGQGAVLVAEFSYLRSDTQGGTDEPNGNGNDGSIIDPTEPGNGSNGNGNGDNGYTDNGYGTARPSRIPQTGQEGSVLPGIAALSVLAVAAAAARRKVTA